MSQEDGQLSPQEAANQKLVEETRSTMPKDLNEAVAQDNEGLIKKFLPAYTGAPLSADVAWKLMPEKGGSPSVVLDNLSKFEPIDSSQIIDRIIASGNTFVLMKRLKEGTLPSGFEKSAIQEKIIANGNFTDEYIEPMGIQDVGALINNLFANHPDKYTGNTAKIMLDNQKDKVSDGSLETVIAEKMIAIGYVEALNDHKNKFKDQGEIQKMIETAKSSKK